MSHHSSVLKSLNVGSSKHHCLLWKLCQFSEKSNFSTNIMYYFILYVDNLGRNPQFPMKQVLSVLKTKEISKGSDERHLFQQETLKASIEY